MSKNNKPGIKLINCSHGTVRRMNGLTVNIESSDNMEVTHCSINSNETLFRGKNLNKVWLHNNKQNTPNSSLI